METEVQNIIMFAKTLFLTSVYIGAGAAVALIAAWTVVAFVINGAHNKYR